MLILFGWVRIASYEIGEVMVNDSGGGQGLPSLDSTFVRHKP